MSENSRCPLCGGAMEAGTTTFAVDYGRGVLVARHVPASVCDQCGEAWLADATSAAMEGLVKEAREKSRQIEVIDLAA